MKQNKGVVCVIRQILILFGVCLVAMAVSAVLPVPVPASVLAMVLLLALLGLKGVKEDSVKGLCDGLQKNMAFLFLPAGVGMLEELEVFRTSGFALAAVCALGTLCTFAATALTVKAVLALQRRRAKR